MESIAELQQTEQQCIQRFRARAAEIKAQHPELSNQVCYARAVSSLPRSAEKYLWARQRLAFAGIEAQPLR